MTRGEGEDLYIYIGQYILSKTNRNKLRSRSGVSGLSKCNNVQTALSGYRLLYATQLDPYMQP